MNAYDFTKYKREEEPFQQFNLINKQTLIGGDRLGVSNITIWPAAYMHTSYDSFQSGSNHFSTGHWGQTSTYNTLNSKNRQMQKFAIERLESLYDSRPLVTRSVEEGLLSPAGGRKWSPVGCPGAAARVS